MLMQRDATAAIARRQQWQTVPIEDCPRTLQAAMQEPCREVGIKSYKYSPRIAVALYALHASKHKGVAWCRLGGWHHPHAALTQLVGAMFRHRTALYGPPQ